MARRSKRRRHANTFEQISAAESQSRQFITLLVAYQRPLKDWYWSRWGARFVLLGAVWTGVGFLVSQMTYSITTVDGSGRVIQVDTFAYGFPWWVIILILSGLLWIAYGIYVGFQSRWG
jgi:hypothetical protein